MGKHQLKIRSRLGLVLGVFVVALMSLAWISVHGLQNQRAAVVTLYSNHVLGEEHASDLAASLGSAHALSLELLLDRNQPANVAAVNAEFVTVSSEVANDIATVKGDSADSPPEIRSLRVISDGWIDIQELRANGEFSALTSVPPTQALARVETLFDSMGAAAASLVHVEVNQAQSSHQYSLASYQSSLRLLLVATALVLLGVLGLLIALIRSILSRTLAYAAFAKKVTEGDFSQPLETPDRDELDELGTALGQLARRWESEESYERVKLEFADAMQLAENEHEAHSLLKHYLERSIDESCVTILNRNNSADRLEAVTVLSEASPLVVSLDGAKPRSCLAVRMARPHLVSPTEDVLMPCAVCSRCSGSTACMPLVVSGEVIGSVLVEHESPITESGERAICEAVFQSAPILGNLRNLAIAETRASTDGLTGLPNRRALQDVLKRMVAQASRTMEPLAALMCDLDHFKQINDRFGHGKGDDVLAAVGAAMSHTLRASDFAGRYGGEEFLILLPATNLEGAVEMAERVRAAVADIQIASIDQRISMSIGIALVPDHAVDGDSLERASDRALYAAKNKGRDRCEIFSAGLRPGDAKLTGSAINDGGEVNELKQEITAVANGTSENVVRR